MKLVVGLGNPEPRYADTYHNVGFAAVDRLASRLCLPDFCFDKKSNAFLSDAVVFGQKTLFCKPNTYMNLSGDAVAFLAHYYKIEPRDMIVLYDDIDIKKGTVRARPDGSAGTHNGMRDIVGKLGSTTFARVRIGTGLRPDFMDLADYVLSHIPPTEQPVLTEACALACDFVETWPKSEPWQTLTASVRVATQ